MEKLSSSVSLHTDILLGFVEGFYAKTYISESGTPFMFEGKPNMERLRFLLDSFLSSGTASLSFGDQKELLAIFSGNLAQYISHLVITGEISEESNELKEFVFDFFRSLENLRTSLSKEEMLQGIRKYVFSHLKLSSLDILSLKKYIQETKKCTVVSVLGSSGRPVFLIQMPSKELLLIDVMTNKVLYEYGISLDKKYAFEGNKLLVFSKPQPWDYDLLRKEVAAFDIINTDATIYTFLSHLAHKYHLPIETLDKEMYSKDQFPHLKISYAVSHQDVFEILYNVIVHRLQFMPIKKQILLENVEKKFLDLGLWDDIGSPTKIPHGFYNKIAIQVPVFEDGKEKVLVTNDTSHDVFDIK